ncbi:hypothetical protein AMAG_17825 [Allomyces macrogynus ATCC 38327]|uniref:Uncharacterized protein n=1 Tax=Allomyces macrogynus (strain ATCC 38327) TaxID=578462 RepID=A0A0L0S043_ALLM3|nr:hypothetical protein AMAG_17825 [Allomyces macrogynus ATCC 38327]|eukprot:KNE55780.1 hypothetical protein AMAG_17825 [Allomyces macrogynus ATCC 38327]
METTTSQLVAAFHERLPAGASELLTASLPAAVAITKAIAPSRALRVAGALALAVATYRIIKALKAPRDLHTLAHVGPLTTIRVILRGLGFMETVHVLNEIVRQEAEVTLANPADVKQMVNDPATFEKVMFDEVGLDL